MKPYQVHKHSWLTVKLTDRSIHFCLCGEESLDNKNPIPAKYGALTNEMKETIRNVYRESSKTPIILETNVTFREGV